MTQSRVERFSLAGEILAAAARMEKRPHRHVETQERELTDPEDGIVKWQDALLHHGANAERTGDEKHDQQPDDQRDRQHHLGLTVSRSGGRQQSEDRQDDRPQERVHDAHAKMVRMSMPRNMYVNARHGVIADR